jgi:acyl-CoA hydrolase
VRRMWIWTIEVERVGNRVTEHVICIAPDAVTAVLIKQAARRVNNRSAPSNLCRSDDTDVKDVQKNDG